MIHVSHNLLHRIAIGIFILLTGSLYAEEFTVTYTFSNKTDVTITPSNAALQARIHRPGGAGIQQQSFGSSGWSATLNPAPEQGFCDAALRIDLTPKSGFSMEITDIETEQTASPSVLARTCCTPGGVRPALKNAGQSTEETTIDSDAEALHFAPAIGTIDSAKKAFSSVYACARTEQAGATWNVSKITIKGNCTSANLPKNTVIISTKKQQQMRFGIDAERLWWWYPAIGSELACYAVGDLKVDYVRVAYFAAYEREEGQKNPAAYERILDMMHALKKENPAIKFFASPRPLHEAYSPEEKKKLFDDNVPWSPYPLWVLPFSQNGTEWKIGELDEKKLTRYIADYLNFMHSEGLEIAYLDLTNECNIDQGKAKYVVEHLKAQLTSGVKMPLIVAASTWNMAQGIEWVNGADQDTIDVISSHNTDPGGSMEAFAELGRKLNKEVWNSELHDWWGIETRDEIINSETLWRHIRAGFNGIDSWLFFGPIGGKDHTMIWTDGQSIRTSYKYEIFKQLVNNANRGYCLPSTMPSDDLYTTAFIKDKTVTIWAFNKSATPAESLGFSMQGVSFKGRKIETTQWSISTPNTGKQSSRTAAQPFFTQTIDGESIYCFKIAQP